VYRLSRLSLWRLCWLRQNIICGFAQAARYNSDDLARNVMREPLNLSHLFPISQAWKNLYGYLGLNFGLLRRSLTHKAIERILVHRCLFDTNNSAEFYLKSALKPLSLIRSHHARQPCRTS